MTKKERSRVDAVIKVGGGIHGQVAVGNEITQSADRYDPAEPITDVDRAQLRALFDALRVQVAEEAPSEQRVGALERLDELTDALTAEDPDVGTVRYVVAWFRKTVPALAIAVRDLVLNPLVSRIVGVAGDVAAADFERFLHDLPGR
jgi:hypothetical protein